MKSRPRPEYRKINGDVTRPIGAPVVNIRVEDAAASSRAYLGIRRCLRCKNRLEEAVVAALQGQRARVKIGTVTAYDATRNETAAGADNSLRK